MTFFSSDDIPIQLIKEESGGGGGGGGGGGSGDKPLGSISEEQDETSSGITLTPRTSSIRSSLSGASGSTPKNNLPKLPTFAGLGKKSNKDGKIAGASPASAKNGDLKNKLIIKDHLDSTTSSDDIIDEISNNGDVHELANNLDDAPKLDHKSKLLDNEPHSMQVSSV